MLNEEPISGWPSAWLEILEFAPPKVSGSIPSGANFGGLSPYRACSGFKWSPASERWDWSPGLVGPWIGYRVFFKKKMLSEVKSLKINF